MMMRQSLRTADRQQTDPLRVRVIRAHHNSIAVGYSNFVSCYRCVLSFFFYFYLFIYLFICLLSRLALGGLRLFLNFWFVNDTASLVLTQFAGGYVHCKIVYCIILNIEEFCHMGPSVFSRMKYC